MENTRLWHSIKGIIFDYGGTIDSRGTHWSEVIWDGYLAAGVKIDKDLFRDAYVHAERALAKHPYIKPEHNFLDLLRIKMLIEFEWLADRNAVDAESVKLLAEQVAQYCYSFAKNCVEEAKETLTALKNRYPMVLVSNFYGNINSVLFDFGLGEMFNCIIESAVVGVRKPDPAIFALGVEALGLKPEEVLVVGDSYKKDILPAESLGCKVAWIKGKGWTAEEDAQLHEAIIPDLKFLATALLT